MHKKLKPGLVASYDIWPGNGDVGEGLFWFWHFINLLLIYLLRHLPTYLQPRTHMGRSRVKTGADKYTETKQYWTFGHVSGDSL